MHNPFNSVLPRMLGFTSLVLMPVGVALADGMQMNGGTMDNGNWYGGGGVWLPVLAVVVLGLVLVAVLRKKS